MDAEEAVTLLIPAMRGVAAAHAHGVVHRDLKPDNIFICRANDGQRREAKVLDFGFSTLSDEGGDQVSITVTGNLVGTPTYMAPEQVRGNKVVDPRSDVYSLGVVLYQMLAGRPPFQGQVYSALMIEIATTDPPSLRSLRPDLSGELETIVHRAMARDLDKRYPDVTSFVHALEGLMGIEAVGAPASRMQALHSERIEIEPLKTPERAETQTLELNRQRVRRTRIAVIVAGAAILAALGIRVLTAPRSTTALKALEERSREAETAQASSGAAPPSAAPAGTETAGTRTAPGATAPERTIGGVPVADPSRAPGAVPVMGINVRATATAPTAGTPAAPVPATKGHGRAHLTASKTDRPDPSSPVKTDQANEPPREQQPPVRERENARLPPANQPATRAGRITIDDF